MLFSSTIFLFAFLPLVLSVYLVLAATGTGVRARNAWLLAASLVFYAWGETGYVAVLVASIVANHAFGRAIDRSATQRRRRGLLAAAVAANLAPLLWFKYAGFFAGVWNGLQGPTSVWRIELAPIHLPIGISFFTFQALTYVVDVYRRDAPVAGSLSRVGLYVSLFPQLVAGPIVRYATIASELGERHATVEDVAAGVRRFVVGLAKKVLVANTLSVPADKIFAVAPGELSAPAAWLGAVCYALQIYFDFSGYSDMAIGLGRMLGFHFPENFLYPYTSRSLREFWRRWHVTLSTWFRDYLYIPLGGNRRGGLRTHANLLAVFVLCGLWHGASATFLVWGLLHGSLMVAERQGLGRLLERLPPWIARSYTLLAVTLAWVVFRCDDLPHAVRYLAALFTPGGDPLGVNALPLFLDPRVALALGAGVVGSAPWLERWRTRVETAGAGWLVARQLALGLLLCACAMALASGTQNPFIYFRF